MKIDLIALCLGACISQGCVNNSAGDGTIPLPGDFDSGVSSPPRTVVDVPDGLGTVDAVQGGTGLPVGGKPTAGPDTRPITVTVDAAPPMADAGGADRATAASDVRAADGSAAAGSCNPLTQDCTGAGQGCFPTGTGNGSCSIAGPGKSIDGTLWQCGDNSQCAAGFTCSESLCEKLCDPAGVAPCPGQSKCKVLAGQAKLGSCSP